MNDKPVYVWF